MFFVLSKTVTLLLTPSNLLIALGLIGLVLMTTRWRRAGAVMASASIVLLVVLGFSPLGAMLTQVLENRFPPWDQSRGAPDGIIVLGGEISPRLSRERGEPVFPGEGARIVAMAKLAKSYPNARIVYSGGDASLLGNEAPETDFLYALLDGLGVARSRVALESRSRNTAENAALTKELVQPKPGERWLLVTSAQHMPRAVGCFRRTGFFVEAYPVGWHTGFEIRPGTIFSSGLAQVDSAVREWIGLLAYWVTGKISVLFPAP